MTHSIFCEDNSSPAIELIKDDGHLNKDNHCSKSFPVLKISLYEYIIRQLLDDGLDGVAALLSKTLNLEAHPYASDHALYTLYEKALFNPEILRRWLHEQRLKDSLDRPSLDVVYKLILSRKSAALDIFNKNNELMNSTVVDRSDKNHLCLPEQLGHSKQDDHISSDVIQEELEIHSNHLKQPWETLWTPLKPVPIKESKLFPIHPSHSQYSTKESTLQNFSMNISGGPDHILCTGDTISCNSNNHTDQITQIVPTFNHPEELWSTMHKDVCSVVVFSPDGRFAASGGKDKSVRLMVSRESRNELVGHETQDKDYSLPSLKRHSQTAKVWTRVFQDHIDSVTALVFSPNNEFLFSGSRDHTIKLYEPAKHKHRRSSHTLRDSFPITTLAVHPSGTMLYSGTTHHIIRAYDLPTLECFTSIKTPQHHTNGITGVSCSTDGSLLASCSLDGSIQFWDTGSFHVVNQLKLAHSGYAVTSTQFSNNNYYLLSSGTDGKIRLWDLRQGLQVQMISPHPDIGASTRGKIKAVFMSDDRYLACITEDSKTDVTFYNVMTGTYMNRLYLHPNRVMDIDSETNSNGLLTAGADYRCRYLQFSSSWLESSFHKYDDSEGHANG